MFIYFRGGDTCESLESLFELGFRKGLNAQFATTYFDEDCKDCQCEYAYRSFDDLMLIANTYFPGSTINDVLLALNSLTVDDNVVIIFYCNDIRKTVVGLYSEVAIRLGNAYTPIGNMFIYKSIYSVLEKNKYSVENIKAIFDSIPVLEPVE